MPNSKPMVRPFIHNPHGMLREENFSDHRGKWGKWSFPWSNASFAPPENTKPATSLQSKLRGDIRIRHEAFGAIIFDPRTTIYYEANLSAFHLLNLLDGTKTRKELTLAAKKKLNIESKELEEFFDALERYRLFE